MVCLSKESAARNLTAKTEKLMGPWPVLNYFAVPDTINIKHSKHGCPPLLHMSAKTWTASNLFFILADTNSYPFPDSKCP